MTQKQTGYMILVICMGALFVSMGPEIQALSTMKDMWSPKFIGAAIFHIGAVIGAYVGGRITPTRIE